jgi:hypothetical protein
VPLDANNETNWFNWKKIETLIGNLIILLSDKLQKCWLCRHTFMVNSPLVAIGSCVSHPCFKGTWHLNRISFIKNGRTGHIYELPRVCFKFFSNGVLQNVFTWNILYRVFHKVLVDVTHTLTCDLTITGKCDRSLMTSHQDVGLGERDQFLGLRGHPTLTHWRTSSRGMSVNTFTFSQYQEQLTNCRNAFTKPSHQSMAVCYI